MPSVIGLLLLTGLPFAAGDVLAQSAVAEARLEARSANRPLPSLKDAARQAQARRPSSQDPREMKNFRRDGRPAIATEGPSSPDATLQIAPGAGTTTQTGGFPGATNNDNGRVLGFLIAPPDTDGEVGPNHFVQMINSITTIYDKNGNVELGPTASNAFWAGVGGNCEPFNQGDPIVLYDETADRWLISQFAFPDNLSSFSQCVAISQTGDPTAGYNRYEFSFDNVGFNDYPKHGIVDDSITMIANLFRIRRFGSSFRGTYLGVMDKAAMYAGQPASLIGFNIGSGEFGFVAGDLDGTGSSPALFATAMSTANRFDIWEIDVDWATENASVNQIASIPITPYDGDLCGATREACVPQPNGGPSLEAISDRLMQRLQIRDFGTYRTMLATHTVDVGGGRAGIRWYEFREIGGTWSLYQEGTFAPTDGQHRWMPSIAMNAAGDIGLGYMISGSNTFVSTAVAGQSAASSGTGQLDSSETLCGVGSGVQLGTARAGDYSATSIDPTDDSFWHTNEVFVSTGDFQWSTYVCSFTVGSSGGVTNRPPTASFLDDCTDLSCSFTDQSTDADGDNTIAQWSWDFGDGTGSSTAQNPSHTYLNPGTYSVTLTVTDNEGATGSVSRNVTVTDTTVNTPPEAAFSFSCTGLDCSFTDQSTDADGDNTIAQRSWDFGDNSGTSGLTNPDYRYAAADTYTVTLTVTDDGGESGTTSKPVTVTTPGGITLSAVGYKDRGRQRADLTWAGASGERVDIIRDGSTLVTTDNDGFYTDNINNRGGGSYVYEVCEEGSTVCSDPVTVAF
jgi:PKD repeat protein